MFDFLHERDPPLDGSLIAYPLFPQRGYSAGLATGGLGMSLRVFHSDQRMPQASTPMVTASEMAVSILTPSGTRKILMPTSTRMTASGTGDT